MKQVLFFLVFFCFFIDLSHAVKADAVIDEVLKETKLSKQHFGIWVKTKEGVYGVNADQLFVPASLSKIPTVLTFLQQHSMADYFHTWIYADGPIKNGVLEGDLYLKGGGDPTFVSESLWMMVDELKRSDIKKINGKIYLDESYFDSDYYSEGRQKRRVDRAYDAPISALSFNWNSLSIYVRPGLKLGDPARVYVNSDIPNIKIINSSRTRHVKKDSISVEREIKGSEIILKVRGDAPLNMEEKAIYKSVGDPTLWTGYNLLDYLKKAGIEYVGGVEKKVTPKSAVQLVEFDSWDMARLVSALSKFSNNFVAESITKQLGKREGTPANIDDGLKKITDYLSAKGWKPNEYTFTNPSGFTSDNKMRPDRLGELLHDSVNNFKLAPEFLSSLPISGTDGTLKKRLRQVMTEKVRAKTGYLSGVVSLGGYLESRSGGDPITFVFFYNGPSKEDWSVRDLFDKLLYRLYQTQ